MASSGGDGTSNGIAAREYPDDKQTFTVRIATFTSIQQFICFLFDRDTILESATARWGTASAAANVGRLKKIGIGEAATAGTAVSSDLDLTTAADTAVALTIDRTQNKFLAGEMLVFDVPAAVAGGANMALQFRFRTNEV